MSALSSRLSLHSAEELLTHKATLPRTYTSSPSPEELHAYQDEEEEFTAEESPTHEAVALTDEEFFSDEAEELEILRCRHLREHYTNYPIGFVYQPPPFQLRRPHLLEHSTFRGVHLPPSSTSAPGHLRSWRFEEYIVVHHYLSMVISALLRRLHLPEHQSTFAPTASRSTLSWFFLCLNSHICAASIYWSTCVLQGVHFSVATTTSTLVFSWRPFSHALRGVYCRHPLHAHPCTSTPPSST